MEEFINSKLADPTLDAALSTLLTPSSVSQAYQQGGYEHHLEYVKYIPM